MAIFNENSLVPEDIKSMQVNVSPMIYNIACGKMEKPRTGLEGKFSMQYAVANALLRGDTGLNAFTDEKVNDPKVKEIMGKIVLKEKKELAKLETIVDLETNSGAMYSKTTDIVKEIPELDKKKEKANQKYENICEPVLGRTKTQETMKVIQSLDQIENIKMFIKNL
ncbi:MAG: MmgE/PrpD family protein [Desulfobacterales bacterium]|nr:MmgE/PrpD family protein [Desulfobacterales bacterium]